MNKRRKIAKRKSLAERVGNRTPTCIKNENTTTSVSVSENDSLVNLAEMPLDNVETSEVSLFTTKTFNQLLAYAASKGDLDRLFDEFWFEGETCCLFGDSNVGKSILAVQIARDVANKRKVLYFDFELSEYQHLRRYSDDTTKKKYDFPDNLLHVSLNYMMNAYSSDELPEQIVKQMESLVKKEKASVIVIDNLTWIAYNSRSAKMAGELMKRLSALKNQYNLSMLILAHTPKRNLSKPINQNDLGGSKMIMNFLDSAFAIGCSSKDPAIRYVKQIKVRYAEMKYGEDNVWLCTIEKIRSFLMFRKIGVGMESEHLKRRKDNDKEATIAKIKAMRSAGATLREIADELGMTISTVDRWSKL